MCHEFEGKTPGPIHPQATSCNKRCYFFHLKHHDPNNLAEGQWSISKSEEFSVFDSADRFDISHRQVLYGVHVVKGRIQLLGTMFEQIALFPKAGLNQAWHGYPMWPIIAPKKVIRKPKVPPKEIIRKMVDAELITMKMRDRLLKGKA